jgi:hypothetical protein
VVWGLYFNPKLDAATFSERLRDFGVDYVLYWRKPGEPVPPAYADESHYPVVFVDKRATIHHVVR